MLRPIDLLKASSGRFLFRTKMCVEVGGCFCACVARGRPRQSVLSVTAMAVRFAGQVVSERFWQIVSAEASDGQRGPALRVV